MFFKKSISFKHEKQVVANEYCMESGEIILVTNEKVLLVKKHLLSKVNEIFYYCQDAANIPEQTYSKNLECYFSLT